MKWATLAGVIFSGSLMSAGQTAREPRSFFRKQVGLSDYQIEMIARGQAVVKMLPSKTPAEIFVFGAVFVNASPDGYVKFALDMSRLRQLPSYRGAGRFSDPPFLSDLDGFVLKPEDIRNLENCKPGRCNLQLPSEARLCCEEYSGADRRPALADVLVYVESPNNWSTNRICRWKSWPGSHRTCPVRIMCTAS